MSARGFAVRNRYVQEELIELLRHGKVKVAEFGFVLLEVVQTLSDAECPILVAKDSNNFLFYIRRTDGPDPDDKFGWELSTSLEGKDYLTE